jgi:DNA-binding CsgD family transcriptional regulator
VLHVGSLASWTSPGDLRVHAAATALRREGNVVVSYDPNVRPDLLGEPGRARPLIERFASVAHIVKASREDIDWLYPGAGLEKVSDLLLDRGALLVVITDGPRGAHLFRAGHPPVSCQGLRVGVADTVGAGDAFTAGLLGGLSRRGLLTPGDLLRWPSELLAAAAGEAVLISALTCERLGADPPFARGGSADPLTPLTRADLDFSRASDPARPGLTPVTRVCVADDHAIVRQGLRVFLTAQPDIEVVGEAATGTAAIALVNRLELEVLRLIADGLSNAIIAERLFIGEGTVKTHVSIILRKLQVADRTKAAALAWQQGIVDHSG